MTYNKKHCSPHAKRIKVLFNRKLLEKLALILSENPNCEKINRKCGDQDPIKKYVLICQGLSDCKSEYCWLTVQDCS